MLLGVSGDNNILHCNCFSVFQCYLCVLCEQWVLISVRIVGTFCQINMVKKRKEPWKFENSASFLRKVLPRAHIFLVILCIVQLLMCSGDMEASPGPDDIKLDQILEKLSTVISDNARHQKEIT